MCMGFKRIVCVAGWLGLIQSVIWTGLSIAGALFYLGVITVQDYQQPADFFKVTLLKLYFESPNKQIDGSYLGKFNPKDFDLLRPDKVFATLIAYIVLGVLYFFLSIFLISNRNVKKGNEGGRLLDIALGWSCTTLVLCIVDGVLMYFLFLDLIQIKDFVNKSGSESSILSKYNHLPELPYVPLALAVVSGRFLVFWIWNFIVGCFLLCDVLCCKKILGTSPKLEPEHEEERKPPPPPKLPQVLPPISLINKSYSTTYDVRKDRDTIDVTRSMEAVTSFSDDYGKTRGSRVYRREWEYAPSDGSVHSVATWLPKSLKAWSAVNEGYESDEDGNMAIEQVPGSHQGEAPSQKLKIVKPRIGKPVSIPVPPPLPAEDAQIEHNRTAGSS